MQQNQQIPTKSIASDNGAYLQVHSIFYTIQGEGPYAGHPAVFVRLAGCNLQCPGCDTEYTEGAQEYTIQAIISEIYRKACAGPKLVVITGGEPFRQNITPLCNELIRGEGIQVQVETNGTLPPNPALRGEVSIVCSPKTGSVHQKMIPRVDAWKYVARADDIMEDGLPSNALGHSAKPRLARPSFPGRAPVYLQPMDEKDPIANYENTRAVVESCMMHGYRLCLQLHKIVKVE